MTKLRYKMRWQQYEENVTLGSLLYTILFIKQVTPACSAMNCRGYLGCEYQTHVLMNPNTLSTELVSSQNHSLCWLSSNVSTNLEKLYTMMVIDSTEVSIALAYFCLLSDET